MGLAMLAVWVDVVLVLLPLPPHAPSSAAQQSATSIAAMSFRCTTERTLLDREFFRQSATVKRTFYRARVIPRRPAGFLGPYAIRSRLTAGESWGMARLYW